MFFSHYLRLHRKALGLDWQGQAIHLGLSREKLTDLALCCCPDWRRPGDVARIAEGIGVSEAAIREVLAYAGQKKARASRWSPDMPPPGR